LLLRERTEQPSCATNEDSKRTNEAIGAWQPAATLHSLLSKRMNAPSFATNEGTEAWQDHVTLHSLLSKRTNLPSFATNGHSKRTNGVIEP
jgi:hypothetical protein